MLNKLFYFILEKVSLALTDYATNIDTFLAKVNSTEIIHTSSLSSDKPPAHWLAMVKKGAPHLLNQQENIFKTADLSLSKIKSANLQSPHKALLSRTLLKTKTVEKQKKSKVIPNIRVNQAKLVTNKTNFISQQTIKNTFPNNDINNTSDSIQAQANLIPPPKIVSVYKKTIVSQVKSQLKTRTPSISVKNNNASIKNVNQQSRENKPFSKKTNRPEYSVKPAQAVQPEKSTAPLTANNPISLHFFPKENIQKPIKPYSFKIVKKTKPEKKPLVFYSRNHIPKTEPHQNIKKNSSVERYEEKINYSANINFISTNNNESLKKEKNHSNNLAHQQRELLDETLKDRWPQLPTSEIDTLKKNSNQISDFWKIQQKMKYQVMSDQEQRGTLWNE